MIWNAFFLELGNRFSRWITRRDDRIAGGHLRPTAMEQETLMAFTERSAARLPATAPLIGAAATLPTSR